MIDGLLGYAVAMAVGVAVFSRAGDGQRQRHHHKSLDNSLFPHHPGFWPGLTERSFQDRVQRFDTCTVNLAESNQLTVTFSYALQDTFRGV